MQRQCNALPRTATSSVRAYLGYIHEHPALLGEEKSKGVMLALLSAYPCPAKRPNTGRTEQHHLVDSRPLNPTWGDPGLRSS